MSPKNLMSFSLAATNLGFEANGVVALRLAKLALGGNAAEREARQMVSEKCGAFVEAQVAAAFAIFSGRPENAHSDALAVYSRHVSANHKRLSRRK